MIGRFVAGDDGGSFRRAAFAALEERYGRYIRDAFTVLNDLEFDYPDIGKVHADQLRYELIFRQSLPFCITEETYFRMASTSSRVLAVLLAGHTLALTQLDYHFDGSSPDPTAGATAQRVDLATAVTYTVRMLYAAGNLAEGITGGHRLFTDAFHPISGFVVSRMHQDWRERYSDCLLREAKYALDEYLSEPTSRLLASGYWELMVRGSFASHDIAPPSRLIRVVQTLRMLRQVVDEIADLDEDLLAGLVTTPLLFALGTNDPRARIEDAVRALWDRRGEPEESLRVQVAQIRAMVAAAGGFERAFDHAHELWERGVAACEKEIGTRGRGYILLLDLKRAKLAELRAAMR